MQRESFFVTIIINILQQKKFKIGQLTSEQRVFIVVQYYSNKYPTKVKIAFANEYNLNINIKTVSNVAIEWRANGTIHNLNKGHSGCSKRVRSEENFVILNEIIQ